MSLSALISGLESKIKLIEQHVAQAAQAAQQHIGLMGLLQGTKEALAEAVKISNELAPELPITKALNEVENVATVIENAVESVEPIAGE